MLEQTLVSTPSELAQARAIIGSVPDLCYSLITIMADLNLLDGEVTTVRELTLVLSPDVLILSSHFIEDTRRREYTRTK